MPSISKQGIDHSPELSPLATPDVTTPDPSLESQIQARAYELYLQRGMEDGHALDDWLQAEQEICQASTLLMAKAA